MSSKALAILGSGPEYNHTAAAPIYFAYGDYTATIHLFNASSDTITVELSCYATGRATPTVPAEYELAPQATRTVDLATLLTPDKVEERVMGAVRLRHTGEKPHDILAGVTVDRDDMRKSFFVPFRYATYDPQAPDKVRIAPFVYLGTEMTSYVALQNLADVPDTASIALNYETGFRGGPTATIELPGVTLDAHETFIVDVSSYADQVPNATWGSVEMRSASQTVVAHAVMISRTGDFAVDCAFVDPASATSTTRVLSPVVFDYDRQSIVYAMVRNVSAAQRTVTYSYTTPSGTQTIDVEIDAGHQQLVVLDSLEVLSAGQTKITDIRLTYTGDPGDIVASGATISEKAQIGLPARSVEARATDTSRFISPYFNLDGNTVAFAQLRNLTGAEIKVGAKLHVEDAPGIPLTSKLVTVPANGDATLDLQDLFNAVPDTLSARGALELQHDGQAGALAATFGVVGVSVRMARAVAVQPVAMAAGCGLTAYPNTFTATPGQVVPLAYMREGGPVTPELLVQGGGTVTPPVAAGDKVYTATYTAPSGFSTVAKQVIAADAQTHVPFTCGTSVGTSVLVDLDERRFTTFDPSGIPTNGRLNNDTVTSFTLRKKANSPSFPAGTLRVSFKKGTQAVLSDEIALASSADEISGTAHPHEQFVGDVKVVVERNNNGEWEAISRNKNVGAYYAFSPPDLSGSTVTPNSLNRAGGEVDITGSNFKSFNNRQPKVKIGGGVVTVTEKLGDTRLKGDLERLLYNDQNDLITICPVGDLLCKQIKVTNPGGKDQDERLSDEIFGFTAGPAPVPTGYTQPVPARDKSRGGAKVKIGGTELWNVGTVIVDSTPLTIEQSSRTDTSVKFVAPVHCPGSITVLVRDLDNVNSAPVPGTFTYVGTDVGVAFPLETYTLGTPSLPRVFEVRMGTSERIVGVYYVGPDLCATMTVNDLQQDLGCIQATVTLEEADINHIVPRPEPVVGMVAWYLVIVDVNAGGCSGTTTKDLTFTLGSTETGADPIQVTLRIVVTK